MNIQIELDDFSEKGLQDLLNLMKSKNVNLKTYFKFDEIDTDDQSDLTSFLETQEIELTQEGNELLDSIEVEGKEWESYSPASGPTYSSGGQPAEGGYYNSVEVSLYLNGETIEITDYLTEKCIESITEKLSEDRMNNNY